MGLTPLPRAENRGLDPAMAFLWPSPPLDVSSTWRRTLCPSTGPKGGVFRKELTSRLTPFCSLSNPPPLGHRPSCGHSSLPLQTSGTLSLLPLCWVTHMVPGPDAQVVTQRHALLPKARAAAGNPNPQAPAWSPSPGSMEGDEDGDPTETCE